MAITNCWECDKSISDNADKCPECGAGQTLYNKSPATFTVKMAFFLILTFIVAGVVGTPLILYIDKLFVQ